MLTQRVVQLLLGRYSWALVLLLIALASFFVANAANVFVYRSLRELPSADTPVKRAQVASNVAVATPATMAKAILDRNLMGARREDMNPKPIEAPKAEESNKVVPCT